MIDTYPMSDDKIKVGYATHKKIVDDLEKQILLRDEKIIDKNKEIQVLNKALDRACGILAVYNGYPSKEDEALLYSNCILANGKQKWKEALLEGVDDDI